MSFVSFDKQFEKAFEDYFDAFFRAKGYTVIDPHDKHIGYDRVHIKPNGKRYTAEYKCDHKAHYTGNFLIEPLNIYPDNSTKPGWSETTKADKLILWIVYGGIAFITDMSVVHQNKRRWERTRGKQRHYNEDGPDPIFHTVPLKEFNWDSTVFLIDPPHGLGPDKNDKYPHPAFVEPISESRGYPLSSQTKLMEREAPSSVRG